MESEVRVLSFFEHIQEDIERSLQAVKLSQ
jgi:hypothetical protein